jgi:hypothetical protein
MTILRRGIMGVDTEPKVDVRVFKAAVFAASHVTGSSVVATIPAEGVIPNFHLAEISNFDRLFCVVCNRHFPVIAFAERPVAMSGIRPMDVPSFAEVMSNLGFEIATVVNLQRPLVPSELELLSKSERKAARYWKPKTVGQVVFNWWD